MSTKHPNKRPIYLNVLLHREIKIAAIRAGLPIAQFLENLLTPLMTPPQPASSTSLSESTSG